jgi:hypothetical protein
VFWAVFPGAARAVEKRAYFEQIAVICPQFAGLSAIFAAPPLFDLSEILPQVFVELQCVAGFGQSLVSEGFFGLVL